MSDHHNHDSDHHEHIQNDGPSGIRGRGNFIIAGLTSGHGVFHWFLQSFIVLLPEVESTFNLSKVCLLYTSPSPRDGLLSRMPSSA